MGDEPPKKIPLMEQSDLYEKESISNSFPEFEHYVIEDENNQNEEKGIMDKVIDVFDNAYYNGLHYKERAKNELKKSGILEKITTGTKVTYENMKIKGMAFYENSKPMMNDIKDKTVSGYKSLKEKTGNVK